MEFRILGPVEAYEGGASVALGGAKQRALLAVLLLSANEVVSTERLIDALWDAPPASATKAVQVYVSRLRKALGGKMPTGRPSGYLLELLPDQLDLARFRRLRDEGRRDPSTASEKLREALALWRGSALAEFAAEPFARVERARLEEERLEVLEERIEVDLASGRHAVLVGELEALVAAHPLRERLRGQLMLALYRCGRQADALATYREGRRELVEGLGIEPGRALRLLEQSILRQDSTLELDASDTALAAQVRASPPAHPVEPSTPSPPFAEEREERKVVSVLFVEPGVSGAGARFEDPEDLRAAFRRFHAVAKREIERFGGTIETLLGNTVMAVFGAPVAHEDDPERAVRAALAIRGWISETGAELRVRMAVGRGLALISFGSGPADGPITSGGVVSTAQRLQTAATVNSILVDEQTYRATRQVVDYRQVPAVAAQATTGVLGAWDVIGARPQRGIDLIREPRTPLVGRQRELELLVSALARVVETHAPQLVTLVGVPGIGKSRLAFELAKIAREGPERTIWRQGRCLSYGDGVSFWGLGELVKAHAGILESDGLEQAKEKLRGAIAEVIHAQDEAAWIERELLPLIGAGGDVPAGEGSEERFTAWRRFLEGVAELRPLVLVLEDIHWADNGLLEFVDELADRVRDVSLLVLCTARPELLERWPGWGGGKSNAFTMSLTPLSNDETALLVVGLLEEPQRTTHLVETLLARAGGNPLYAEQFARALAEIGSTEEVPETVEAIIAARLDSLPAAEKSILQDASVVGRRFWPGALQAVGEHPDRGARQLLLALQRKEFVQEARRSAVEGEAEYVFRHILLRDVAYSQIPRSGRGRKHQRAADWIESLGRPDDHAETLAHHHLMALEYAKAAAREDPRLVERARGALRTAGDRALALSSYATAARFYSAALELWPESDPDRVWLLVHAGRARFGASRTGLDLLEAAAEELHARGDLDGAAEVAVELARGLWLGGNSDRASAYIDWALELTKERGYSPARAYALVERAAYHMHASEHAQAIVVAREALPLTETLSIGELQARTLDILGSSRVYSGDRGGIEDSLGAIGLAREHNAFSRLIVAELNLYCQQFFLGQLAAGAETLRAARRDVDDYGTADQRKWLQVAAARHAVLDGRWSDADPIVDQLIADTEAGADPYYLDPACLALRASLALARGALGAASSDSVTALEGARRTRDPQILASALVIRATVLLAQGRPEEASKLAAEILAHGPALVHGLLELHAPATPVELAWLLRDLGLEAELARILTPPPTNPWLDAASAIVNRNWTHGIELVARIGAPSIDAYTRLRAAGELAQLGRHAEATEHLEHALVFFEEVGATRYLALAEELSRERD